MAKTKLFISWSGATSQSIALTLREWIPSVIQNIDPWVSSEDIEKGGRWSNSIAEELSERKTAIFCLTPENLESTWLHFEAGAMSNKVSNVCTYLFNVTNASVKSALNQFQSTNCMDKKDNLKLLATLNKALEEPLTDKRLESAFETYWPVLEVSLKEVADTKPATEVKPQLTEMVEEILNRVRAMENRSGTAAKLRRDILAAADIGMGTDLINENNLERLFWLLQHDPPGAASSPRALTSEMLQGRNVLSSKPTAIPVKHIPAKPAISRVKAIPRPPKPTPKPRSE